MFSQQLLGVGNGLDVSAFQQGHHAAIHQKPRLTGVAQDVQTDSLRGQRNAGEIDVCRDVFVAHHRQRIAVGLVLVMTHQRAHVALRVVVLGLGKTIVDEEGRTALQAFAQGGDEGFGLAVNLSDAVGRKGQVSGGWFQVGGSTRPLKFFIVPGHTHFRPTHAVKVQQLHRHGV